MSAVTIIRSLLTASANLTAVVPATRIMAGVLPQGTAVPAISITEISRQDRQLLKSQSYNRSTSRVQVTVMASTYPQQKQILSLVRKACRDQIGQIGPYGVLNGSSGSYFSTPDSAATSITGDLDLRVHVALNDWTPATSQTLISKDNGSNDRSYWLVVSFSASRFRIYISNNGTSVSIATCDANHNIPDGELKWVRCTYSSTTGDVIFYLSDDGQTWSQLGSTITITPVTIYNGSTPVMIGASSGGTGSVASGKFYKAQIFNGINGTLAADFTPPWPYFANSFVGSTGETWTANGAATVVATTNGTTVLLDGTGPDFQDFDNGFYMQSQDFWVSFVEAT